MASTSSARTGITYPSSQERANDSRVRYDRPITWQRVLLHVLYWIIAYLITYLQFGRIFQDVKNPQLVLIWTTNHFLATAVAFYILGQLMLPVVLRLRHKESRLVGVVLTSMVIYYAVMALYMNITFAYLDTHFQKLPAYLSNRMPAARAATVATYFTNPGIIFFVYAHYMSYVVIPLLIKAVRNSLRDRDQSVALANEYGELTTANVRLEKEKEVLTLEIENEKVTREKDNILKDLKFLRSQINPHFLFNALNNIFSKIRKISPEAAHTLADLSNLLRYALYDTQGDFVRLDKELTFLEGYVAIEKMRHFEPDQIQCTITSGQNHLFIPPLLLVTFVENTFKHGMDQQLGGGWVSITIQVDVDQSVLNCAIGNNKPAHVSPVDRPGGLGLANVRKRLALLFEEKDYNLIIEDTSSEYWVRLQMPLVEGSNLPYSTAHEWQQSNAPVDYSS